MKKLVVSVLAFLAPYFCYGETLDSSLEKLKKDWSTEAQVNTISNSVSATFGPALLYKLNSTNQIGLRFLAPLLSNERGTISLMGVYRNYFSKNKTNLFGEGTLGANWYSFKNSLTVTNASSFGTNMGIIHHLTEDISFGGLCGLEWAVTPLERDFSSNESESIYAWGRIALFASLNF